MKVTQEKLPNSQIGLEIEIPAQTSQSKYEEVLNNLSRNANIPGFRKGKVPRQILLQRLGSRYIKAVALEELINKSVETAIEQESIAAIGNYQLRSNFEELVGQFTPGEPLVVSAAVDVPPTVTLGDYRSLTVRAEQIESLPEKVDEWLAEKQREQAPLVPVEDRPAQDKDEVTIDYEGFIDENGTPGEALEGVQATDFAIVLEPGRLIEGMIEGIIGMELDQTKAISVTFPEDYPREDLAGKPVIFNVTLKEIKVRELPELDDEFAEEVSEYATLAELKASLAEQFAEEAKERTDSNVREAIVQKLAEISEFDLPETLIQQEITNTLTEQARQLERMGIDLRQLFTQENLPKFRENARPQATQRLKIACALQEVAKTEAIEAKKEDVQSRLSELKQELAGNKEIDFDRLEEVLAEEERVEATLKWLAENVTVEFVPEGTLEQEESAEASVEAAVEAEPEAKVDEATAAEPAEVAAEEAAPQKAEEKATAEASAEKPAKSKSSSSKGSSSKSSTPKK